MKAFVIAAGTFLAAHAGAAPQPRMIMMENGGILSEVPPEVMNIITLHFAGLPQDYLTLPKT